MPAHQIISKNCDQRNKYVFVLQKESNEPKCSSREEVRVLSFEKPGYLTAIQVAFNFLCTSDIDFH